MARTINECVLFICIQNNPQNGYNRRIARVYGKGVMEGPEIPTYVGLPYRKSLPFSVQVERQPAEGFSYATWQMATGVPAQVPPD